MREDWPSFRAAGDQMADAIVEKFDPILLNPVADLLES